MRMGYAGVADAKPPARVRRVSSREDLPIGAGATGRTGDWLLENESITAVVADVDRSLRGGHLVDMARVPGRFDELERLDTIVSGLGVRYQSLKTGTDEVTGTAYVQVTGHPEGVPDFEVVTRYDLAPDLSGVLVHTSLDLRGRTIAGALGVGDAVSFRGRSTRIVTGSADLAAFGADASYALEPLAEPPLVLAQAGSGGTVGLSPEFVVTTSPEEPFIYSRVVAMLERPDDVALAVTRASASGQALGEVDVDVVALPRKLGLSIAGGKLLFHRAGSLEKALELPIGASIRPGDRQLAKLPVGRYEISFEGGGYGSDRPTIAEVGPRVLTPVRLEVRQLPPPNAPPSTDTPAP